MCGIIGYASQLPGDCPSWLFAGSAALKHRGPDDSGIWRSADLRVGFGHRRLSIVDLSSAGHQPMVDEKNCVAIVFNGEIYNYKELRKCLEGVGYQFMTRTDTEVILAAYVTWGGACVQKLNGMFAFAIYDYNRRSILMARDRVGEKPLFYSCHDGVLRFASELKGLFADSSVPRRINRCALHTYLSLGYVPGNNCIISGISKLPPAHTLHYDLISGECRVSRYWTLPKLLEMPDLFGDDLVTELECRLERAVARQLVADVPVGILLSGGVDSSLIAALASRHSTDLHTFSITFPGNQQFDEASHARLIARHFGTNHIELPAGPASAEIVPKLARQFDEPIADSSMIPTWLVSKLVRAHCKVALGGDGGDELFGGYSHYRQLRWFDDKLRFVPSFARSLVATTAGLLPVGFRGRSLLQRLSSDNGRICVSDALFDLMARNRLIGEYDTVAATSLLRELMPLDADVVQRATRQDFCNYLPDNILVKVDRASMLNSLELRSPFLDFELVEFAFGKVPSDLKATSRESKILLKRLTEKILPLDFDRVRKQGFSVPLGEWLRSGPFLELTKDVLLDKDSIFNRKIVGKLLKGQRLGYSNGDRLFALLVFELWRKEYSVAF